ncbi:hypothetical protein CRENBAI_019086 [Crenichthys baileyi]|uniref:Uncharacterized protein n=1 Tax=Crenichthys baileyi TaxID=28760 RepID=A0AAV9QZU4_9TELE
MGTQVTGYFQALALFPVCFPLLDLRFKPPVPSLDKLQAGSSLALQSTGHNHKRTLFTLQRAVQAPPPSAPRHLLHSTD